MAWITVYPDWVHRTAITILLKIYAKTSHTSGPLNFAGKVTSVPLNWKILGINIGHINIHPRDVKAFTWWLCNQYFAVTTELQWSCLSQEWTHLSDFLCKVYQSRCWCISLWDLVITRDWGQSRIPTLIFLLCFFFFFFLLFHHTLKLLINLLLWDTGII